LSVAASAVAAMNADAISRNFEWRRGPWERFAMG
jgi:hypothetical protein